MKTLKISLFAIMLGALASCTKTGPTGPAGADGAANIYMATYIIDPGDWNSYNSNTWDCAVGISIPTTDVVNVYVSFNNTTFTPLPSNSFFYPDDFLTFVYGSNSNLTLWEYFSSVQPGTTIYAKVADIPPAIYVKHPNTNWNNYSEVAALPEVKALSNTTIK
jgi:hypothetical protein